MSELQARQYVLWLLANHKPLIRTRMVREYGRVVATAANYLYLTDIIDFKDGEFRQKRALVAA